ncbi:MAG TPA: glycosyltransferase family 39 protein [Pyrinomonadaceae bacterium]|nr:glycosyltransferase family 39 protein [Pyrinomonadaceae bacterium]
MRKNSVIRGILFVTLALFYFYGLTIPLLGPDEPRYAQVAREMFERGDWITPTLGGFTWFEKPVLLYWLEIISFRTFGVSEFAARLGPATFGLLIICALWLFGKNIGLQATNEIYGLNKQKFGEVAFSDLLAVTAASTIGLIVFSRGASFDIVLTFPLTASLLCFYVWKTGRAGSWALISFYFFSGLSVLAKGLVGIIFPFAIAAVFEATSWFLARKEKSASPIIARNFFKTLAWGTFITIAVSAIWFLPMYLIHGWKFIDEFIIQHHFVRYTSNKYLHPQPFYFFLWVLPLMLLPWTWFFIVGIYRSIREIWKSRLFAEKGPSENFGLNSLKLYLIIWITIPLVFFSLSGSKLPGYILPAVPPAIVIAAIEIRKFVNGKLSKLLFVYSLAAAVFIVSAVLLTFVVPRFAADESVKSLVEAADREGFLESRLAGLHTIEHNLEFYAAGRLIRNRDGGQHLFYGTSEIYELAKSEGKPLLVLVPNEYKKQVEEDKNFNKRLLATNAQYSLFAVSVSDFVSTDAGSSDAESRENN